MVPLSKRLRQAPQAPKLFLHVLHLYTALLVPPTPPLPLYTAKIMTDISVVILVGNEERHIGRCLEKLAALAPRQVFVVESQHGDRTHEVAVETARRMGWEPCRGGERVEREDVGCRCRGSEGEKIELQTVFHTWPGLQAKQFNWAIDNLPIVGEWVLRLDADEYLTDATIERMKSELASIPSSTCGLTLELKRKFCGGEIRHATTGIRQVRLFRRGCARYDEGLMDERLVVEKVGGGGEGKGEPCSEGEIVQDFDGAFYDDSLMPMDEWKEKHRGYAKREAAQAMESLRTGVWTDPRKASYYKLPRYLRAFAYFCIRYFLKGGILDGRAGWQWNFWQGLWYRCLVDREVGRLKR